MDRKWILGDSFNSIIQRKRNTHEGKENIEAVGWLAPGWTILRAYSVILNPKGLDGIERNSRGFWFVEDKIPFNPLGLGISQTSHKEWDKVQAGSLHWGEEKKRRWVGPLFRGLPSLDYLMSFLWIFSTDIFTIRFIKTVGDACLIVGFFSQINSENNLLNASHASWSSRCRSIRTKQDT
jgi:hypothetical protein